MGSLLRSKALSPRPAETPRKVWVELTSKCPVDCIFCSRRTLRGAGEHMPYGLFESLIGQISDPRIFCLNYSGESTVYPELVPRDSACARHGRPGRVGLGASVRSGIDARRAERKWIDPAYGFDSCRGCVEIRGDLWLRVVRDSSPTAGPLSGTLPGSRNAPRVDIAFVAMDRNLAELPAVTAFAESMGCAKSRCFR